MEMFGTATMTAFSAPMLIEPFSSGLVVEVEDDQGGGSYGGDRGGGQADFAEGFEVFE